MIAWLVDHLVSFLIFAGVVASTLLGLNNKRQINEVHLTMNSRLDALLDLTRQVAEAKGRDDERARQNVDKPVS